MDAWQTLNAELDAWEACGKVADLWWRDDDAVAVGSSLNRLLSVTKKTGLLLAVIPAMAEETLADAVKATTYVKVAQHGYAHINHAKRSHGNGIGKVKGAWELGLHRSEQTVLDELEIGRARLEALFGDDFIPVIVPPWNHMDPSLLRPAALRGFCGVSGFGPRDISVPEYDIDGFTVVNSHCDLIRWKTGAKFKGAEKTVNQLIEHLRARRTGIVDADEPTGYLTHHLDMDDEGWEFSEQLVQHINRHPAACWCKDVAAVFRGSL